MTNGEKYKSADERADAFTKFCLQHDWKCSECPLDNACHMNNNTASLFWLDLETEKPLPCPFCGGECAVEKRHSDGCAVVWCPTCGYESGHIATMEGAIAEHNRIARAVQAQKEGDAK